MEKTIGVARSGLKPQRQAESRIRSGRQSGYSAMSEWTYSSGRSQMVFVQDEVETGFCPVSIVKMPGPS